VDLGNTVDVVQASCGDSGKVMEDRAWGKKVLNRRLCLGAFLYKREVTLWPFELCRSRQPRILNIAGDRVVVYPKILLFQVPT
jgi:hypothetical protein